MVYDRFTTTAHSTTGPTNREMVIRQRVRRVAEFYRHACVYGIVITALWCLCLGLQWNGTLPTRWWSYWAIWPTFGWGIGVALHGLSVGSFGGVFAHDWEEKKVNELLARDAANTPGNTPQ